MITTKKQAFAKSAEACFCYIRIMIFEVFPNWEIENIRDTVETVWIVWEYLKRK